jgi:L-aminopeptidase/D-esterase-like protein
LIEKLALTVLLAAVPASVAAAEKPRARELGLVPLIGGTAGALDAITDVAGVEVGQTTLIAGEGRLVPGKGPVRTGVTVVHPRGRASGDAVFGAWFTLNGNGEMTGTTWLEESGFLGGPIMITNTHSVGVVHDAVIEWIVKRGKAFDWSLPVVAETWDGTLNDINGFHVTKEHVFAALDSARGGPVAEGNVGGGTGMMCHGFKGGIGTSSRVVKAGSGSHTVGVLVQANFGRRPQLLVAGVPVGREIPQTPAQAANGVVDDPVRGDLGSITIVVGTDAPLLPHQLKRLARRATLGMARTGGMSGNGSGDIFIAFSTANPDAFKAEGLATLQMVSNEEISPIFDATVLATEEAIVNAMVAAETMTGAAGRRVERLPHDRLREALKKYNRLAP